jgi:hypothetical protein
MKEDGGVTSANPKPHSVSSPPTAAARYLSLSRVSLSTFFHNSISNSSISQFSLINFPYFYSLSSAGASSPAFDATGEGSRRDKSSADSYMVIGSALRGVSNPSCRPWERCDLLRRLSTFKLAGKLPKVCCVFVPHFCVMCM